MEKKVEFDEFDRNLNCQDTCITLNLLICRIRAYLTGPTRQVAKSHFPSRGEDKKYAMNKYINNTKTSLCQEYSKRTTILIKSL
jgi:hypothetical protein